MNADILSKETKESIIEAINAESMRLANGIYAEETKRKLIIKAYHDSNGEISLIHFRRANPYLFARNGALSVEIGAFDVFDYYFSMVIGWFVAGSSIIFSMLVMSIFNSLQPKATIGLLVVGLIFFGFGIFIICQTLPVFSARKIEDYFAKKSDPGKNS